MNKPHVPTVVSIGIVVIVLLVGYHFLMHRKG